MFKPAVPTFPYCIGDPVSTVPSLPQTRGERLQYDSLNIYLHWSAKNMQKIIPNLRCLEIYCLLFPSLSLRHHPHAPLAEHLMHITHKIGNTSGVSKHHQVPRTSAVSLKVWLCETIYCPISWSINTVSLLATAQPMAFSILNIFEFILISMLWSKSIFTYLCCLFNSLSFSSIGSTIAVGVCDTGGILITSNPEWLWNSQSIRNVTSSWNLAWFD